jgi:hypothetical protein
MAGSSNVLKQRTGFDRLTFTLRLPLSSKSASVTAIRVSYSALETETHCRRRTSSDAICIRLSRSLTTLPRTLELIRLETMRSVALGTPNLRNKTQCPEGLRNYWMGHAGRDMSDLYDKIKEDVAFRSG